MYLNKFFSLCYFKEFKSFEVLLIVHISGYMRVLAYLTLIYCMPFLKGGCGGLTSASK